MFTACVRDGVLGAVCSLTVFKKGVQSGVLTAGVQDGVFRVVCSLPVFRMVCSERCVLCLCSGRGVQSDCVHWPCCSEWCVHWLCSGWGAQSGCVHWPWCSESYVHWPWCSEWCVQDGVFRVVVFTGRGIQSGVFTGCVQDVVFRVVCSGHGVQGMVFRVVCSLAVFRTVYYLGQLSAKKAAIEDGAKNEGFDDKDGFYVCKQRDHLLFRYEIQELLGKGTFGQVRQSVIMLTDRRYLFPFSPSASSESDEVSRQVLLLCCLFLRQVYV